MAPKASNKAVVSTSDHKVDSMTVLEYIQKRGVVSTNDVATKFGIRPQQAAANLAILRIKEKIESSPKPPNSKDQSSRWTAST